MSVSPNNHQLALPNAGDMPVTGARPLPFYQLHLLVHLLKLPNLKSDLTAPTTSQSLCTEDLSAPQSFAAYFSSLPYTAYPPPILTRPRTPATSVAQTFFAAGACISDPPPRSASWCSCASLKATATARSAYPSSSEASSPATGLACGMSPAVFETIDPGTPRDRPTPRSPCGSRQTARACPCTTP